MPARLVPLAVGTTAGAVSGLAESGLVHRLTRGRMWIGLLTTLLVGIVALNVFTLSVNATSSRTTRQTDVLQRQNSALQGQIAAAGASSLAGKLGMIVPELGSIGYVEAGPKDAALAAQRLESGAITASATTTTDTTTPTATTTVPTTTPTTPTATTPTTPVATPTTTPPTATVTPTTTTDPASGTATGAVSTP